MPPPHSPRSPSVSAYSSLACCKATKNCRSTTVSETSCNQSLFIFDERLSFCPQAVSPRAAGRPCKRELQRNRLSSSTTYRTRGRREICHERGRAFESGVRHGGEQVTVVGFGRRDLGLEHSGTAELGHGGTVREDDDVLPLVELLQLGADGRTAIHGYCPHPSGAVMRAFVGEDGQKQGVDHEEHALAHASSRLNHQRLCHRLASAARASQRVPRRTRAHHGWRRTSHRGPWPRKRPRGASTSTRRQATAPV